MSPIVSNIAKTLFLRGLRELSQRFTGIDFGEVGGGSSETRNRRCAQPLRSTMNASSNVALLFGGDVGIGESWMDGDWSSPDLVSVVQAGRPQIMDGARAGARTGLVSASDAGVRSLLRHRLRKNSITGSRKNIHAHYDLSNAFFRLFLDHAA